MKIRPRIHPVPIVLLGVRNPLHEEKANFMTLGDIAIAGLEPPLLMVSLHERHLSREGIDRYQQFSIHVPEMDQVEILDCCGMVSGRDADKSGLFSYRWDEEVPIIETMPIALVCTPVHRAQIQQRVIYIARVTRQIIRPDIDPEDLSNLQTILYGLDNRYYQSGECIGEGYRIGKELAEGLKRSEK